MSAQYKARPPKPAQPRTLINYCRRVADRDRLTPRSQASLLKHLQGCPECQERAHKLGFES